MESQGVNGSFLKGSGSSIKKSIVKDVKEISAGLKEHRNDLAKEVKFENQIKPRQDQQS